MMIVMMMMMATEIIITMNQDDNNKCSNRCDEGDMYDEGDDDHDYVFDCNKVMMLASFKLSYVSPENHKIGKSGWWKWGRKNGVWRRKTGFENFLLDENESF